ncbi:MAG: gamma-butyrobetaine hydroxylase-like domain-containing protein [Thalassobaculaceae bacterium]
MTGSPTKTWPLEIRVKSKEKILEIDFDDGASFAITAELLRVESPSAEIQGHGSGQKVTPAGRRHVNILNVEPVGNYAIKISFDDLHDTGIFSWQYLYDLGANQQDFLDSYIVRLNELGASRDP